MNEIKVGLLLPRSSTNPPFTQQVLRGIKEAFAYHNCPVSIQMEDVGKGVLKDTMEKANKLVLDEVDIIMAMVGYNVLHELTGICHSLSKPLILMDAGANSKRQDITKSPYVFKNSFDLWMSMYFAAPYIAEKVGKNVLVTSSFYEVGYQFMSMFLESYEKSGGAMTRLHTTRYFKPEDFDQNFNTFYSEMPPDVILATYNGKEVEEFKELCIDKGYCHDLSVITTSYGTDFNQYPSLYRAGAWFPQVDTDLSRAFVSLYKQKYNTEPETNAALGFETASLVAQAALKAGNDFFNADAFCKAMNEVPLQGLRGNIVFEKQLSQPTTHYLQLQEAGETKLVPLPALDNSIIEEIVNRTTEMISAGWYNPYPCA